MARLGHFWGGWSDPAMNSLFDVVVANGCGQAGFACNGVFRDEQNFWKSGFELHEGPCQQEQWLAFNSQTIPDNTGGYWYWVNPLSRRTILEKYALPGSTKLADVRATDYAMSWARNALEKAKLLNYHGAHIRGIFADSICWSWWWGGAMSDFYATSLEYRTFQVGWCSIVADYLRRNGLKFGANFSGFPDFADWTGMCEIVDFAIREHVTPTLPMTRATIDPARNYSLGIHIQADDTIPMPKIEQLHEMRVRYDGALSPFDAIMLGFADAKEFVWSLGVVA